MSDFVFAAETQSLLPGHGRTVHVCGRAMALYNIEGEFYALDDQCPHRGGSLGAGTLEHGQIYCPLHAWGFDPRTGQCSNRPDREVRVYPTRVVGHTVEVLPIPKPSSLPPVSESDLED